SKTAGQRPAFEFRPETLDGNLVTSESDVATQTCRPQIALPRLVAALQPGCQRLRIGGIDFGRPSKSHPVRADVQTPAQPHLGRARRPKFEPVETPSVRAACDITAQILNSATPKCYLVNGNADLNRQPGAKDYGAQVCEAANAGRDRGSSRIAA